jgi:hypothetical protein
MRKRNALAALIAVAAVLALFGLVAAQRAAKLVDKRLVSKTDLRQQRKEKAREDATPVGEAALTQQQKEHSKLYKQYKTGKKLRDLTETVGDVSLRRDVGTQGSDYNEGGLDLQKFLQSMTVDADAIVIGTVKNKSSQLTEDEDYVFTDYELSIDEVLKDNPQAPIREHGKITITRPGGTILLNGHVVEALDESFQPFRKGVQYVLFLRFIPSTGGYQALNSRASFQLEDNKVNKLTKEQFTFDNSDVSAFVQQVRAAAGNAASGKKKGGAN